MIAWTTEASTARLSSGHLIQRRSQARPQPDQTFTDSAATFSLSL